MTVRPDLKRHEPPTEAEPVRRRRRWINFVTFVGGLALLALAWWLLQQDAVTDVAGLLVAALACLACPFVNRTPSPD